MPRQALPLVGAGRENKLLANAKTNQIGGPGPRGLVPVPSPSLATSSTSLRRLRPSPASPQAFATPGAPTTPLTNNHAWQHAGNHLLRHLPQVIGGCPRSRRLCATGLPPWTASPASNRPPCLLLAPGQRPPSPRGPSASSADPSGERRLRGREGVGGQPPPLGLSTDPPLPNLPRELPRCRANRHPVHAGGPSWPPALLASPPPRPPPTPRAGSPRCAARLAP